MKSLQILEQLLNGNHLNEAELKQAEQIIYSLNSAIDKLKPRKIEFTRINNDTNGNPRYVCHYLEFAGTYNEALKVAKQLGGKRYNNKSYGGGIVFQSYNIQDLEKKIIELTK